MADIRERFAGDCVARFTVAVKDGGLPGWGERAVRRLGLDAELRWGAGEVRGGWCFGSRKVDFRLASYEGQLHLAGGTCRVLIDGIRMEVGVIVVALVVQRLNVEVRNRGTGDGGGGL